MQPLPIVPLKPAASTCLVGDPLGKQQMGPKVDRPWRQVDKPVEVGEIWTQQVDEAHQRPPARLV